MKRIISASYKDDTPAFHSEEFFDAYNKGYIFIPSKAGQRHISLKPEDVYAIVFWTKNPSDHFIHNMDSLRSPFYIQWTLTGYDKDIERNLPLKTDLVERFRAVSALLGPNRVIWRYDPIFVSDKYSVRWHKLAFEQLCEHLEGATTKVVISFMDEYNKIADLVKKGVMRAPTREEVYELSAFMAETATKHHMTVQTCSEQDYDLTAYGIHEAPCIDADFIEKEFGITVPEELKKSNSFRRCLCAVNTDIGQYHRCLHGCEYCYAK